MSNSKYNNIKYLKQTFGKLTVQRFGIDQFNHFSWVCSCSCGSGEKNYIPSKVYNGRVQSCGCESVNNKNTYRNNNYIGKIYKGLEVISIKQYDALKKSEGVLWICKCTICGKTLECPARHVVSGRYSSCGSLECRRKLELNNAVLHSKNFIGKRFGYLEVLEIGYGRLKSGVSGTTWKCLCHKCGNVVTILASDAHKGNKLSCGCNVSLHELWLKEIFTEHNIEFRAQVSFNGLVGIGGKPLRFDFAIIDTRGNKKLLEYDGAQHNITSEYTGDWDIARIKEHDRLKDKFCEENNIELIRVTKKFNTKNDLYNYLVHNRIV